MTIDESTMRDLVRNGCAAADLVAIRPAPTEAERTRRVVQRAIEALEANGLIQVTPVREWPSYFMPDPPFRLPGDPRASK